MPTLYVTEPGAVVRRSGGSLVVTVSEKIEGNGDSSSRQRRLLEVEPHRLVHHFAGRTRAHHVGFDAPLPGTGNCCGLV